MRRAFIATLTALALVALIAAPASAVTLKRTWWTNLGTSGSNGRIQLNAWTNGTGAMSVTLKGAKKSWTHAIKVRSGGCSVAGSVLFDAGSARTDATGAVTVSRTLSLNPMNRVWGKIRFSSVSVWVTTKTTKHCGILVFNKATRVYIPSYSINLPVIASSGYPKCGVAMYIRELSQPREPGVTYLYAHARTGMFLPLLNASKVSNGASMIGKQVRVYTTDNKMFTYQIDRVRRHVSSIQNSLGITSERLWLQTSEGPNFTYPKLVVEAKRIAVQNVSYATAHPTPHPRTC